MAPQHSTTEQEFWKPIKICPKYDISNLGRIRRCVRGPNTQAGRILSPSVNVKNGYVYVTLSPVGEKRRKFLVHRLVAIAFLGDPPEHLPHVNHIDTIRTHNYVKNLEWTDRSGNMKHAFKMGTRSAVGENSSRALVTNEQVLEIRRLFATGVRDKELAPMFGMTRGGMNAITSGINWKHLLPK